MHTRIKLTICLCLLASLLGVPALAAPAPGARRKADALVQRAAHLYLQKRYVEALALCRQATQADPTYPRAFVGLGTSTMALQQREAACAAFRTALKVGATGADAQRARAGLKKLGCPETAPAIKATPKPPAVAPPVPEGHTLTATPPPPHAEVVATPTPMPPPTPAPAPPTTMLAGTVWGIETLGAGDGRIILTVLPSGATTTARYEVAPTATARRRLLREKPGQSPTFGAPRAVAVQALMAGEAIEVALDANHRVVGILASVWVTPAQVVSVRGEQIELDVNRGQPWNIGRGVRFVDGAGRSTPFANVQPGQIVALFRQPQTRTAYQISIYPPDLKLAGVGVEGAGKR